MSLRKLLPGQIVLDHFLVQFPGVDDGIAVDLLECSSKKRSSIPKYDDRGKSGSDGCWVGVPILLIKYLFIEYIS